MKAKKHPLVHFNDEYDKRVKQFNMGGPFDTPGNETATAYVVKDYSNYKPKKQFVGAAPAKKYGGAMKAKKKK